MSQLKGEAKSGVGAVNTQADRKQQLWTGGPGEPWSPGESPVGREMDELCQSEPSLVMALLGQPL